MEISIAIASDADAAEIAALRSVVAENLTERYGRGHWSSCPTEKSVLRGIKTSRVLIARSDSRGGVRGRAHDGARIVATLRLATKKPWAIDTKYFASVARPLYLHDLAVEPSLQGQALGARVVAEAIAVARAWPRDAIRLDAYDVPAGAGGFYASCGFREVGRVTYRSVPLIYYELLL